MSHNQANVNRSNRNNCKSVHTNKW